MHVSAVKAVEVDEEYLYGRTVRPLQTHNGWTFCDIIKVKGFF